MFEKNSTYMTAIPYEGKDYNEYLSSEGIYFYKTT